MPGQTVAENCYVQNKLNDANDVMILRLRDLEKNIRPYKQGFNNNIFAINSVSTNSEQ